MVGKIDIRAAFLQLGELLETSSEETENDAGRMRNENRGKNFGYSTDLGKFVKGRDGLGL